MSKRPGHLGPHFGFCTTSSAQSDDIHGPGARAQAVAVMVAAGAGLALLPASLARIVGEAAAVIPLRKAPRIEHVFARAAGPLSPPLRDFTALLMAGKRRAV